MKKLLSISALLVLVITVSCKKTKTTPPIDNTDPSGYNLNGDITSDRTLKSGNTYYLQSMVYVKGGATLTIESGVTIKATKGKNALVITRGSKIMAIGSSDKPIVFTSNEATPGYGDWGGIVILGKAKTNSSYNGQPGIGQIEGGVDNANGDGQYGGSDDADNSGTLKFVRIEYGGYPFQPDKELNSLTLGGVGSGTTIDYVMCAYGYDDAFEMFGGTVNLKHIIAYKTLDDDFDCDNGYRGTVQFAIAIRDKDNADISGSNGFEQDNDASGSATEPITAPVFANVTLIGPKQDAGTTIASNFKRAAHIRRNAKTSIFNSILMGYPTGILIDGAKCATNLVNGDIKLKGIVLAGISGKSLDTTGTTSTGLDLTGLFNTAGWNNDTKTNTSDAGLTAPYGTGSSFNPAPASGSLSATGGVSIPSGAATQTSYRGAVAAGENWWNGWAEFK